MVPSVLGGLICGLALGNVALVIIDPSFDHIMKNDFDLEAFSSMLCWGGLSGACIGSVFLNRIAGRRFSIAFAAFIATFGSLGSVCAQDSFGTSETFDRRISITPHIDPNQDYSHLDFFKASHSESSLIPCQFMWPRYRRRIFVE